MTNNGSTGTSGDLQAAIAVTRFGLGARPGEINRASGDPKGWLKAQIRRSGADQPATALPSSRDRMVALLAYRDQIKALKREHGVSVERTPTPAGESSTGSMSSITPASAFADSPAASANGDDAFRRARRAELKPLQDEELAEILGRFQLASETPAGFRERWTLFWSNHFTVATAKLQSAVLAGPFEREAIRPNVFGSFQDLLIASSFHPGMLLYLDQAQSAGPDSPAAQRQRRLGLNENLAREILELHTLGADAGYTQADVTEFARALTGYSIGNGKGRFGGQAGEALFRSVQHEPGPRRVMGKVYGGTGPDQARAILADLAANPHTARHLARQLAAHFVADDPPPALVAQLEHAFLRTNGDLAEVAEALIDAPEAWAPPAVKLKTPYEFLVSGYRAAAARPTLARPEIAQPLLALGQRPFSAPQPNGWSDLASDWAAPDALIKRMTWAQAFAAAYTPAGPPPELARDALGSRLSLATAAAVSRAESRPEAFAILLMSPEFQRR